MGLLTAANDANTISRTKMLKFMAVKVVEMLVGSFMKKGMYKSKRIAIEI